MRRRTFALRSSVARLVGTCVALVIALAAAPGAEAAPAGFDLFETDPEATKFRFRQELTIPAGFLDPGAQPFEGDVHFGGVPVHVFRGRDVGDADTIVERKQAANLPGPGSSATVPIELVSLSLVSVEPIQVRVGGTAQQWDVVATPSPSRPSTGLMAIRQTSAQGGTFDSSLEVFPLFTFQRRSDGATRVLDVGGLPLPIRSRQKLRLEATNTPWRRGCVSPALSVRGVNDDFCPALTAGGEKQLTVEQATLARHGVRPAQPRVEHFKCYGIRSRSRFRRRTVRLRDQFGSQRARVVRPLELCNPVRKNQEPLRNRRAHLKCYTLGARSFRRRLVAVRNQFGFASLALTRPRTLCVPSLKRRGARKRRVPRARGTVLTDHFMCYGVRARTRFRARRVLLRDEFHLERARVLRPVSLCAPVQKNRERVEHPVRHLVCYRIRARGRFRPRLARVRNQFGTELVVALRPRTLCAPSIKLRLPPPVQPPPPPDQPPGPCAGIFQRGATPNSIRWSARCQGAFNRLRIVTPGRQILNPVNEPAGLSCQTTTTSTPNDTRDCTGNVAAGTGVGGEFGTNPQTATNQGGQGAALNGAAQTDFNFQGPNP